MDFSKITENIKVRELLDELTVGNTKINTFNDFFIKRSIMMKIFFRTKIKSLNYEIRVVNGNTYIIGIADDDKASSEIYTRTRVHTVGDCYYNRYLPIWGG